MSELQQVFQFENNDASSETSFEDFAHDNGARFWFASDFIRMLGYESLQTAHNAINRAMTACMTLQISVVENFTQFQRQEGGKTFEDYKLTRFACYLIAMNADPRKHRVATAQAYFAAVAETVRQIQEFEDVERVLIREEVSGREKSLSSTAKQAGVVNYAFFQNAGYLGMYNMNLSQLRTRRGLPGSVTPLDYMGKTELAGNLFRITQTEEKIKNEKIKGQQSLEIAAKEVGKKVRKTMIEISNVPPESLPVKEDIKTVKKTLKASHKEMKALDAPKKKKKQEPEDE